jgi:hypothetical protein
MRKGRLVFRAHRFQPEDFCEFIHTKPFDRLWRKIGLDDEEDLSLLQATIMIDPKGSPVISGTGGARKLRFAPPDWPVGQSGALRVVYAYIEEFHVAVLALVYPKGVKENISNEDKQAIKKALAEIEAQLRR